MYRPDPETLPLLGGIVDQLARATPIRDTFERQPKFLATLPSGALYFDSELQLDTDGWPEGRNSGDRTWQRDTSWSYANNTPINANQVPYFVLPKGGWENKFGIKLGDYAAVIFKDRLAFAVFADRGDETRLGEGSIELLRQLGEERLKPDGRIRNAGMGPGVITIVFPNSGERRRFANQAALKAEILAKAPPLFADLGGTLAMPPLPRLRARGAFTALEGARAMKVCVDPGHGMSNRTRGVFDTGCTHTENGSLFREADIVLKYGLTLKDVLRARGVDVFMSRDDDTDHAPVGARAGNAERAGCQKFLSIHVNDADDDTANGIEVLYNDNADKILAQRAQDALVAATGLHDRRIKQRTDLAVLKFHGPALLVELGFIANDRDRDTMLNPQVREKICLAIADVLQDVQPAQAQSKAKGRKKPAGRQPRRRKPSG